MGIGKKAPVKLCDEPIGDMMEYLELMIKKKKKTNSFESRFMCIFCYFNAGLPTIVCTNGVSVGLKYEQFRKDLVFCLYFICFICTKAPEGRTVVWRVSKCTVTPKAGQRGGLGELRSQGQLTGPVEYSGCIQKHQLSKCPL